MTSPRVSAGDTVRFSDRFSAFVVDFLILATAQILSSFVLSRVLQAAGMRTVAPCIEDDLVLCEGPSSAAWAIVAIAFVVVTIGYHAFFEGLHGATPGKRMAGLIVTDRVRSNGKIGVGRGLIRSLVRQLFFWALLLVFATSAGLERSAGLTAWFVVGLAAGFASLVSAAFSPHGRSLHDVIAVSRVQYVRSAETPAIQDLRSAQAGVIGRPFLDGDSVQGPDSEDEYPHAQSEAAHATDEEE